MKVVIKDYDASWPALFEAERQRIAAALVQLSPAIEHIGSTSVPGLGAKPIIDILVGVNEERQLDEVIAPMISAGYYYMKVYEPMMPYRRYFVKLSAVPQTISPGIVDADDIRPGQQGLSSTVNIHILTKDTLHWNRHIAFRDYLRAFPDVRQQYYELKKSLTNMDFRDHIHYNGLKDPFIKEHEGKALEWWLGE